MYRGHTLGSPPTLNASYHQDYRIFVVSNPDKSLKAFAAGVLSGGVTLRHTSHSHCIVVVF